MSTENFWYTGGCLLRHALSSDAQWGEIFEHISCYLRGRDTDSHSEKWLRSELIHRRSFVQNVLQTYPHTSGEHAHAISLSKIMFYGHTEIKARHYFICCQSGSHLINKDKRKTKEVHPHQKESRKLDSTCISRLYYVDKHGDGHVSVEYIWAHTHELGPSELKHLPLRAPSKKCQWR